MQPIFSFFSLIMMFTGIVSAQSGWVRQYPPLQARDVNLISVSFVDANTGFIVGGYGTILHTTNGGTNWVGQVSGTTKWIRGISVMDTNTAIAVGDSGTILYTTNGGTTWTPQLSGTMNWLRGLSAADKNTATAVGESGIILHTTNGGVTWMRQSSGTVNTLRSISFVNANIGTVVGDSGTILRTTNGGTTWTSQSIATNYQLLGVSFTDTNTGTVVGVYQSSLTCSMCHDNGAAILRTTNGGMSWERQMPDSLNTVWAQGFPDPIFGISFTDANTGTVALYNYIFHTTNGGGILYTLDVKKDKGYWIRQVVDSNYFFGVCFTDVNTGTVVGTHGTILHTTTGGITAVKNEPTQVTDQFLLEQNFPNPFNPSTTIQYSLKRASNVTISVYDIIGRQVQVLLDEKKYPGTYQIIFDGYNLTSGIYFIRLQSGTSIETRKIVLVK